MVSFQYNCTKVAHSSLFRHEVEKELKIYVLRSHRSNPCIMNIKWMYACVYIYIHKATVTQLNTIHVLAYFSSAQVHILVHILPRHSHANTEIIFSFLQTFCTSIKCADRVFTNSNGDVKLNLNIACTLHLSSMFNGMMANEHICTPPCTYSIL